MQCSAKEKAKLAQKLCTICKQLQFFLLFSFACQTLPLPVTSAGGEAKSCWHFGQLSVCSRRGRRRRLWSLIGSVAFRFSSLFERTCSESLNNKQEDRKTTLSGGICSCTMSLKPFPLFTVTAGAVEVPNHIKVLGKHTKNHISWNLRSGLQ